MDQGKGEEMPTTAAPAKCEVCAAAQVRDREVYYYMGLYEFDVGRARKLAHDGRQPVEVEPADVRHCVDRSNIHEEHVNHVDAELPGIIAHVEYVTQEGEQLKGHVLIDGHHRASRCLREEKPFRAFLLTKQESKRVLRRRPIRGETALVNGYRPGPQLEPPDPTMDAYEKEFADSLTFAKRSRAAIAGATTHDRRDFGPFPVYFKRAKGAMKWDVSGRRILDYWMGHGALLMGHGFAPVVQAVARQLRRGTHFGGCHELEVEWAELVCRLIPSAEKVRFTASGTEATLLALRVARAYTGKNVVVKFQHHFHGWHDEAMGHFYDAEQAGFNYAALQHLGLADSVESAVKLMKEHPVAAVILEPGGGSAGGLPGSRDDLQALRDATREQGTLLIFDEVITGFRQSPGGVQAVTGVIPDLTTLAKIVSGGLPGGAVAGRSEIMDVFGHGTDRDGRLAKVPHTGTFNANPLSAAAGVAMLQHIADGRAQRTAQTAADRLVKLVNQAADDNRVDVHLYTNGCSIYHILIGARQAGFPLEASPAVFSLYRESPNRYAMLRRALLLEGVDTHPLHGWVSAVHDQEVLAQTAEAFDRAFRRLRHEDGFQL